ncbi:GNAT family N-acetyltransferase [Paenilisteria rocourtiae]|uniref:Putative acetyltransferase n=1 Tax=Listeria rocourtiae TaxID=647910 RepID=A0A4R6ZIB4_9LIST|nr:N-acetyltransferase [Listeria rocourtiae]EUJ47687.1 acetyltransferase [Listeria rocourtiae FSL F6-920]MBC1604884.1 N-acetyltransferase [Listeria rocourtiae]TDR51978.1 putative acetyltransferase [Listeria rocourtiae]
MITIDVVKQEDTIGVREVLKASFPTHAESHLVDAIVDSEHYVPELALVARTGAEIIGYSLLSECYVGEELILVLAPVAVKPEWQAKGIGAQLIEAGIVKAKATKYSCISVLGHETYYPRFGFELAKNYQITAPFDVPDVNFMVYPLAEPVPSGMVRYPASFDVV